MEYLTKLLWSELDLGEQYGIVPLEFDELEQQTLSELEANHQKEVDEVNGDRNKLQEKIVVRVNKIREELTQHHLIDCSSFMEKTYDQSDFAARLFLN